MRFISALIVMTVAVASNCTAAQTVSPSAPKATHAKPNKTKRAAEKDSPAGAAYGASTKAEDDFDESAEEPCTEARVQPAVEACYPTKLGAIKDWTAFVQATVDEKGTVIKAKTLQVLLSSGLDTPQINEFKKSVQLCAEKNVMNGAAQPMLCGNRPAGAQVVVPVRPVQGASQAW